MKTFKLFGKKTMLAVLMLSILFLNAQAGEKKEVNKTFKPMGTLQIKTVSGDCTIKKGNDNEIKVHLVHTYTDQEFEPIFSEEGNTLIIKEDFKDHGSHEGSSQWTVTVPGKTAVEFKSASGDLDVEGLNSSLSVEVASGDIQANAINGSIDVKAASGDLKIGNSSGEIDAKTASGDLEITGAIGTFDVKTASGDIRATGIELKGASSFEGVSGEVLVKLAKSSTVDLKLAAVSGDITLDYNGNPVQGYFVFKGMKNNIQSDIPFDGSEGSEYNPFAERYFKKGETPKVTLKAVSGEIKFKK